MPSTLKIRSYAKINLGLEVLGKRDDGYHEVLSVMQAVSLHDVLNISPASSLEVASTRLNLVNSENLVWRAAEALRRLAGINAGARIAITKAIPARAGLGGGSSDAAAALLGLNRFWETGCKTSDLAPIAASLGSDIPFFLMGGTALAAGRGEALQPLPSSPDNVVVLAMPAAGLVTGDVYGELRTSEHSDGSLTRRLAAGIERGKLDVASMHNALQGPALRLCPGIQSVVNILHAAGAARCLLSGSGSACFGLFTDAELAASAQASLIGGGFWTQTCRFVPAWDGAPPLADGA